MLSQQICSNPQIYKFPKNSNYDIHRGLNSLFEVVMPLAGGQGGRNLAHLKFWVSSNPIPITGADYAHCITACPPGFENLMASEASL